MNQLRSSLSQVVHSILPEKSQKMLALFWDWKEIVGPREGARLKPLRWSWGGQGVKVWASFTQLGGAMEVQYTIPVLQQRLSSYVGFPVRLILEKPCPEIKKNRLMRKPLETQEKTLEAIEKIEHPSLRQAYERWYKAATGSDEGQS